MWQKLGLWLLDKAARALIENRESIIAYIVLTVNAFANGKLTGEERDMMRREGSELLKKLGESFIE